ncbi:hypothetical protein [Paenibacillus sp. FSL P4-0081]|nr:hypothetical protein [Paenibacillus sp. FSL P4-0081]
MEIYGEGMRKELSRIIAKDLIPKEDFSGKKESFQECLKQVNK